MDNKKFLRDIIEIFQDAELNSLKMEIPNFKISISKNSNALENILSTKASNNNIAIPDDIAIKSKVQNSNLQDINAGEVIRSPIVGTYYSAPGPDKDEFVRLGDNVKKGEPMCIIEAMKMMNEVCAPYDLIVKKINCLNGELIEFNQSIFEVEKC
ncbi:acetyl-CoA carboxylase biotin carboxyl carrier protein [Eubacteriales bacterium KG127]